ncbi:MAG: adenylate/guanylate cyclase domain-containing protein [Saprospiraceae bacterium]
MKFFFILVATFASYCLLAQDQPIPPLPKDAETKVGPDQVEKNLQLARSYYESGDYREASRAANKVMEVAPGLGMGKQMKEATKILVLSEQILAFHRSRSKGDGTGSMAVALQLSDLFYKNGQYDKAAELASESYQDAVQVDNKSFMATALNKEAKAVLKNDKASKSDMEDARLKLRKSLKLINENKMMDPRLKKENLEYLEELGDHYIRADEFNKSTEALKMVMDSININLGSWQFQDMHFNLADLDDSNKMRKVVIGHPNEMRDYKSEDFYKKIIVLNRDRMAKELISPLPPPTPNGPDAQIMVKQVTDEMKELWPTQLKAIDDDFSESESRIGKLATPDVRKELLVATYKNKYDSLMHLHVIDSINLEKQKLSIQQHEAEMDKQKARRSYMMTGSGSTLLLSFFLFVGFTRQKKNNRMLSLKNVEIQMAQDRSEELLLNILPAQVADELKQFGESKARRYDNVSVLFSDFIDFTRIAEKMTPEVLVKDLDYCFKAFDKIIGKHSLEKIKTIGDAYMCAGGLADGTENYTTQIVQAAMEIQQFLNHWKAEKLEKGEPYFEARIGIHTGSVVAGVVGMKKYAYDIWGDTVNIASRMELSSEPGRINISGETYKMLGDNFTCTYRGKVKAKNKGEIDMYFVEDTLI